MENGEEDGVDKGPVSAFAAMRKKFEQQENNNVVKPAITPKPKVAAKFGGPGGELNIFNSNKSQETESKPGVNKPGNIAANKPTPDSPKEKTPSTPTKDGPARRNSSLNISSVFLQDASTVVPALKPKPKLEPKTKSDSNNNPDKSISDTPNTDNKDSAMKPDSKVPGFPKPGGSSSPRGGGHVANVLQGFSPDLLKQQLKPVKPVKPIIDKSSTQNNDTPLKPSDNKLTREESLVERRKKFESLGGGVSGGSIPNRSRCKSVIRKGDNKKFHKVENSFKNTGEPPAKPDKLDFEIDLDNLMEEFKKQVKIFESAASTVTEYEEDDIYDDTLAPRPVSEILPLTEEDEQDEDQWNKAGFPGLDAAGKDVSDLPPPPEDWYDDGISAAEKSEEVTADELYEPLPDDEPAFPPPPIMPKAPVEKPPPPPPGEPKSSRKTSDAEDAKPKETEKERKKREKAEREEKEREERQKKEMQEKKEKELKKLLKTFNITAEEIVKSVGKGKIKKTKTKSLIKDKKCLDVQEGEMVDIIRMTNNNAKGKWLVRLDNTETVGYVDADNIEVDTGDIRSLMQTKGSNPSSSGIEDDQEMYEAVDGEANGIEDLEEDDVYEALD